MATRSRSPPNRPILPYAQSATAAKATTPQHSQVEIKRQASPDAPARTEKFEIPYRPNMNITSVLGEIACDPVTADGTATTAIAYDANCLEEICGSCAMLINGKARMACSALVDKLRDGDDAPITLAPLSKFPVVRDLAVDRSVLFQNLKAVKAWVPIDGTYDLGPAPRQFPQIQEQRYPLSNCISCTICMGGLPPVQRLRPTSWAQPPSRRSSSSTWTPPEPSSSRNVYAPWPATAASRSAAWPRTASLPAPNSSPHRSHLRRQPLRRLPAGQGLFHPLTTVPKVARIRWRLLLLLRPSTRASTCFALQ